MTGTIFASAADMSVRATASDSLRRQQLRDFLFSRRARLTPAEVGVATFGRRRTPGLRREEVAMLAGVGVSWYTWLEQGRDINPSTEVLDAISRALRLSEVERVHLHVLAGLSAPRMEGSAPAQVPEQMLGLIDSWNPHPAILNDRAWNILATNTAARVVFGLGETDRNCLVAFFTNETYRQRHDHWDSMAASVVSAFRADVAPLSDDPEITRLVGELGQASPEFLELWSRHEVSERTHTVKAVQHPRAGSLEFDATSLAVADHPDWHLVLYNPRPDTPTSDRLHQLMRTGGVPSIRRSLVAPVPGSAQRGERQHARG